MRPLRGRARVLALGDRRRRSRPGDSTPRLAPAAGEGHLLAPCLEHAAAGARLARVRQLPSAHSRRRSRDDDRGTAADALPGRALPRPRARRGSGKRGDLAHRAGRRRRARRRLPARRHRDGLCRKGSDRPDGDEPPRRVRVRDRARRKRAARHRARRQRVPDRRTAGGAAPRRRFAGAREAAQLEMRIVMKSKWLARLVLAVFVATTTAAPASAGPGDSMVRIKPGFIGANAIGAICNLLGCSVLLGLDVLPGQTTGGALYLVRGLPVIGWLLNLTLSTLGLASVEADQPVTLADGNPFRNDQISASVLDELWRGTHKAYYGTPSLQSYLEQPASDIVGVRFAHCGLRATGGGIVAVIDTGIDALHPTLAPHLVPGYDFTRNVAGGCERSDVDQISASVLDEVFDVNAATMAGVDQISASVLDDPSHVAFGHGTMVAGVIHLVAPTASIMPLKTFDDSGEGYTSSVIRALHYASANGAK